MIRVSLLAVNVLLDARDANAVQMNSRARFIVNANLIVVGTNPLFMYVL